MHHSFKHLILIAALFEASCSGGGSGTLPASQTQATAVGTAPHSLAPKGTAATHITTILHTLTNGVGVYEYVWGNTLPLLPMAWPSAAYNGDATKVLAQTPDGRVWVADNTKKQILVLTPAPPPHAAIAPVPPSASQIINYPAGVSSITSGTYGAHAGLVYFTDYTDGQLWTIDPSTNMLALASTYVAGAAGVATDETGLIYVAIPSKQQIAILAPGVPTVANAWGGVATDFFSPFYISWESHNDTMFTQDVGPLNGNPGAEYFTSNVWPGNATAAVAYTSGILPGPTGIVADSSPMVGVAVGETLYIYVGAPNWFQSTSYTYARTQQMITSLAPSYNNLMPTYVDRRVHT